MVTRLHYGKDYKHMAAIVLELLKKQYPDLPEEVLIKRVKWALDNIKEYEI